MQGFTRHPPTTPKLLQVAAQCQPAPGEPVRAQGRTRCLHALSVSPTPRPPPSRSTPYPNPWAACPHAAARLRHLHPPGAGDPAYRTIAVWNDPENVNHRGFDVIPQASEFNRGGWKFTLQGSHFIREGLRLNLEASQRHPEASWVLVSCLRNRGCFTTRDLRARRGATDEQTRAGP